MDPELNLWSYVKIKLPRKLSNLFAFPVKKDYIMVLGGVKSVFFDKKLNREYEKEVPKDRLNSKNVVRVEKIDKNVYLFSQSKQSWHCLKPLSEKMKVCNVIPSGDFRFNCFLLQQSSATQVSTKGEKNAVIRPINVVYDLKVVCPRLDRYWFNDHISKAKNIKLHKESNSQSFLRSVQIKNKSVENN